MQIRSPKEIANAADAAGKVKANLTSNNAFSAKFIGMSLPQAHSSHLADCCPWLPDTDFRKHRQETRRSRKCSAAWYSPSA